jgi:hypothetical protein
MGKAAIRCATDLVFRYQFHHRRDTSSTFTNRLSVV